jgi:hypothetical protein
LRDRLLGFTLVSEKLFPNNKNCAAEINISGVVDDKYMEFFVGALLQAFALDAVK